MPILLIRKWSQFSSINKLEMGIANSGMAEDSMAVGIIYNNRARSILVKKKQYIAIDEIQIVCQIHNMHTSPLTTMVE